MLLIIQKVVQVNFEVHYFEELEYGNTANHPKILAINNIMNNFQFVLCFSPIHLGAYIDKVSCFSYQLEFLINWHKVIVSYRVNGQFMMFFYKFLNLSGLNIYSRLKSVN